MSKYIYVILSAACVLFSGCASDDVVATKVDKPKYPRISNVRTKDYATGLSSIPIRTRVDEVSPFYYNGRDTRFIKLHVLDDVYRQNDEVVIPCGSTIFAVQDKRTGRYANVTRIRREGHDSWTPAYGVAEIAPKGYLSMVFLSKVSMQQDD